ncbi:hypothetical protein [Halobellus inordinatus]|uniref:hypothetical protein n=1 Tax=Halobellus inordinatus TaxID=1126236 RepID=UPI00210CC97B|nr:hypothetical protein [Halobellus inordinatus]
MATRSDATTTSKPPAVVDVDVVGDRVLATVDRGDVSIVVEGPAGISGDELEELLNDVPEKIEFVADLFDGGDR